MCASTSKIISLQPEADRFLEEWHSDSPYITAHTSGSTGMPKEIHLSKHDMRSSARATNSFFCIDAASQLLCPLSANYIAGKMMVVRALEAGCSLVMEKPSNTPMASGVKNRVKLLPVVPSQVPFLLEHPELLAHVDNLLIGGAPVSRLQEARLTECNINAYASYGMTETCSHVALRRIGSTVYTALPGISFDVDSRGCLVIIAPEFSFGRLVTNDAVELLSATTFRWLGRADNVVNSGGIKLFPEQLEARLSPWIHRPFFLTSKPDEKWGETLVMVIEFSADSERELRLLENEVAEICREKLLPRECPKKIVTMTQLPRTANGKLIRRLPQ